MAKKTVKVAGRDITQLTETTYEADNPQESLDFYFETGDEVMVYVYDSTISNKSGQDPLLGVWYAGSLEEAVAECMTFTKKTMKGYEWFKN